jgi:hypothetical protein
MDNPYSAPSATLTNSGIEEENTSGMGKAATIPEGVKGWSWGAFLLTWIWSIGNSTWIGLLTLIPYVGLVMAIMLGLKGREWAWRNKRWDSVEHFNRVQKRWSFWGVLIVVGMMGLGILAALAIPAYYDYQQRVGISQPR